MLARAAAHILLSLPMRRKVLLFLSVNYIVLYAKGEQGGAYLGCRGRPSRRILCPPYEGMVVGFVYVEHYTVYRHKNANDKNRQRPIKSQARMVDTCSEAELDILRKKRS